MRLCWIKHLVLEIFVILNKNLNFFFLLMGLLRSKDTKVDVICVLCEFVSSICGIFTLVTFKSLLCRMDGVKMPLHFILSGWGEVTHVAIEDFELQVNRLNVSLHAVLFVGSVATPCALSSVPRVLQEVLLFISWVANWKGKGRLWIRAERWGSERYLRLC